MNKVQSVALAAMLALGAGCATTPELPETVALPQVRSFSGHPEGDALPPGWQPWILSRFKRPTAYRLVNEQGRTVVSARAESSASGLIHPLKLDPHSYPQLHWHWKVDQLIQKADNTQKHLEDSPVRLVVSFGGDIDSLEIRDRMFFDNVRLLTGQQMPYATLMYIWENRAPLETVIEHQNDRRRIGTRAAGPVAGSHPQRCRRLQTRLRQISRADHVDRHHDRHRQHRRQCARLVWRY